MVLMVLVKLVLLMEEKYSVVLLVELNWRLVFIVRYVVFILKRFLGFVFVVVLDLVLMLSMVWNELNSFIGI